MAKREHMNLQRFQQTTAPPSTFFPQDMHLSSQLIAISGPVYVMFDNNLCPQKKSAKPITVVSIPGINFAYSKIDRLEFTREISTKTDDDDDETPSQKKRRSVDEAKALQRMKQIMHHVFVLFRDDKIKFPCLNAIGCGAFKGPFQEVPQLWALAAFELLRDNDYGFEAVFYSLPNFGDDNFAIFGDVFQRRQSEHNEKLKAPVVMISDLSMVAIADWLSRKDVLAGMLNPSDVKAIRQVRCGRLFSVRAPAWSVWA